MQLDWYYDFISPFAYLQLERIRRSHPALPFTPVPLLFGALLAHYRQMGPAEIGAKRRVTYESVVWRAQHDEIPLRFPPRHPFNPIPALRLAIVGGGRLDFVQAIFRHIWRDGLTLDTEEEVAVFATTRGRSNPIEAMRSEPVKAELRSNGSRALAAGVFGVPSFVVNGRVFWGDESTPMLLDYLHDPIAFDTPEMLRVASLPIGVERIR